jgi:hypothetical protein
MGIENRILRRMFGLKKKHVKVAGESAIMNGFIIYVLQQILLEVSNQGERNGWESVACMEEVQKIHIQNFSRKI